MVKQSLRAKESLGRELRLAKKDLIENKIIDVMIEYSDLIQKPMVKEGSKAIVARPSERIKELL